MDYVQVVFYVAASFVVSLLALSFFLGGIAEWRRGKRLGALRRELELRGVMGTGQVERLSPVNPYKNKKSPGSNYTVTFHYTYRDESYSGYSLVRLSQIQRMALEVGSPLTIHHLPEDPGRAMVLAFDEDVNSLASARSTIIGAILLFLMAGFYWVIFMVTKH
jgi:hypothetical protein